MIVSSLTIRDFKTDDFDALCMIDQVCFPKDRVFSRAEFVLYFNHPQRIARVAETEDRILGFVLAHIQNSFCARVLTLDVIPEARKCGIATRLMNALHEELKRQAITACLLEVGVDNIPAQHLYEILHYYYIGTLPGYYCGREDAYQLIRLCDSDN